MKCNLLDFQIWSTWNMPNFKAGANFREVEDT